MKGVRRRVSIIVLAVMLIKVSALPDVSVSAALDLDKPTVTAAVYDGKLIIEAADETSEIRSIYVNGEEFKDITDGMLTIRLQQFDANFAMFRVQAIDRAGNASNLYMVQNPYYVNPASEDDAVPPELPVNGASSKVYDSKATVTEHTYTQEPVTEEDADGVETVVGTELVGKEFYTIVADSGKVFYLIIDHERSDNNVYFLTEVSENDLLNVTGSTYQTLTQDAKVIESETQIYVQTVQTDPNASQGMDGTTGGNAGEQIGNEGVSGSGPDGEKYIVNLDGTTSPAGQNSNGKNGGPGNLSVWISNLSSEAKSYILIGAGALVLFIVLYFVKIRGAKNRRKPVYDDEDEEDEYIQTTSDEDEQ